MQHIHPVPRKGMAGMSDGHTLPCDSSQVCILTSTMVGIPTGAEEKGTRPNSPGRKINLRRILDRRRCWVSLTISPAAFPQKPGESLSRRVRLFWNDDGSEVFLSDFIIDINVLDFGPQLWDCKLSIHNSRRSPREFRLSGRENLRNIRSGV